MLARSEVSFDGDIEIVNTSLELPLAPPPKLETDDADDDEAPPPSPPLALR